MIEDRAPRRGQDQVAIHACLRARLIHGLFNETQVVCSWPSSSQGYLKSCCWGCSGMQLTLYTAKRAGHLLTGFRSRLDGVKTTRSRMDSITEFVYAPYLQICHVHCSYRIQQLQSDPCFDVPEEYKNRISPTPGRGRVSLYFHFIFSYVENNRLGNCEETTISQEFRDASSMSTQFKECQCMHLSTRYHEMVNMDMTSSTIIFSVIIIFSRLLALHVCIPQRTTTFRFAQATLMN